MVSVVLSAQCTDVNVNNVTKNIYPKYNKPEHFVKLGRKKIEKLIKSIVLFRTKDKSVYFFGDGAQKFNDIINRENFIFLDNINPDSKFMGELSYDKFVNNQFEDLPSFEPNYIKDFYLNSTLYFSFGD